MLKVPVNTYLPPKEKNRQKKGSGEKEERKTEYTVISGDTLFSIARKLHVPLKEFMAINNIGPADIIKTGQVLKIPESSYRMIGKDTHKTVAKKKEAEKNLLRALRNNPDYIPAYLELARIFENEGKTEKAKEIYFRLINLYPKLQYPYCALGEVYLKEGKRKLSRKYFKKCMEINPARKRGAMIRFIGSIAIISIPDNCSVAFIKPISAVSAEPARPAKSKAATTGPSSLTNEAATITPKVSSAPKSDKI
jgi:LysM repeat protein